jgi:fatty acid desaturase
MRASLNDDPRYQDLRRRLAEVGFFQPSGVRQALRAVAFFGVVALGYVALLRRPGLGPRIGWWAAIGFFLVQGCFLAHEAMHGAVSRRPAVGRLIGQIFDTFLVGFSFSYFCRSHELHHFHCNEEGIDPDTQSTLFSVFEASTRDKAGLGWFFTRFQQVLIPVFYPVWALTMQWDALTYVARNPEKTRADRLALLLHVLLWFGVAPHFVGWGPAIVNYLGRSVFAGIYLAMVIPINHVGRRPVGPDVALPFLDQQLYCTRNLGTSPAMDFLFMGLNCHVEHHLFPWVPTSRLGRGRALLRAFCASESLPYHEQSFPSAVRDVMVHFARMARLVAARSGGIAQAAAPPSAMSTRPMS